MYGTLRMRALNPKAEIRNPELTEGNEEHEEENQVPGSNLASFENKGD